MSTWAARVTVACVVEKDGRYLMVEERDKTTGKLVFNQPAGHLEQGETLQQAALRETREETGWTVELTGVLSVALYAVQANGNTYYRNTFAARAISVAADAPIDPDIHAVHWMDYESILANSARMRSPLAIASIDRQRSGTLYPLDLIIIP